MLAVILFQIFILVQPEYYNHYITNNNFTDNKTNIKGNCNKGDIDILVHTCACVCVCVCVCARVHV